MTKDKFDYTYTRISSNLVTAAHGKSRMKYAIYFVYTQHKSCCLRAPITNKMLFSHLSSIWLVTQLVHNN